MTSFSQSLIVVILLLTSRPRLHGGRLLHQATLFSFVFPITCAAEEQKDDEGWYDAVESYLDGWYSCAKTLSEEYLKSSDSNDDESQESPGSWYSLDDLMEQTNDFVEQGAEWMGQGKEWVEEKLQDPKNSKFASVAMNMVAAHVGGVAGHGIKGMTRTYFGNSDGSSPRDAFRLQELLQQASRHQMQLHDKWIRLNDEANALRNGHVDKERKLGYAAEVRKLLEDAKKDVDNLRKQVNEA